MMIIMTVATFPAASNSLSITTRHASQSLRTSVQLLIDQLQSKVTPCHGLIVNRVVEGPRPRPDARPAGHVAMVCMN